MDWYYAEDKEQVGPVSSREFRDLVATGKISNETLVWHDGMQDWQPYGDTLPPPIKKKSASGVKVCSECGLLFSPEDMKNIGGVLACVQCAPSVFESMPAVEQEKPVVYAALLTRGLAKGIDVLVLSIVFMMVFMVLGAAGAVDLDFSGMTPKEVESVMNELQTKWLWLQILVSMSYSCFFHGRYGATPGKMACRLKVVYANGRSIGYKGAAMRYLAEMLSGIFMIGYAMAAFDAQRRALHDMLVNTRVVNKS